MFLRLSKWLFLATFTALLMSGGGATAAVKQPAKASAKISARNPQVYTFRGLLNVFSYGMDDLANQITAAGVPAKSYNHTRWPAIADDIVKAYKADPKGTRPIVLIGHSLGANAVLVMAEQLGRAGVPVDLVVTFDPTIGTPISSNVRRYLNLYESHDMWGVPLPEAKNVTNSNIRFRKDIDISGVNHGNIDKNQVLHQQVVAEVVKLAGIKSAK
jgi:thioesterase domain-containing protein